ncbi:HupE/UreJ family protein [soil metagenome]
MLPVILWTPLRWKSSATLAFLLFLVTVRAFAHDPGLSSAEIEVAGRAVTLLVTYNDSDIGHKVGEPVADLRAGTANAKEKLEQTASRAAVLRVSGEAITPTTVAARPEGENNIEFRYEFVLPPAVAELSFESLLLPELSFGHRQVFAARGTGGTELTRRILSSRENIAAVPLDPAEAAAHGTSGFRGFFMLGIHHIVTGYDHLLFLLGLLIVCRTARSGVWLITSFTVAHSLTLALSTFGLVDLPGVFVEATIAASILYVGVENLLRRDQPLRWRWLLTFVFGLIHGLGFAGVLHDIGVAKTGSAAVLPLFAFNLGVEAGQLAIAAIVLPIIWKLRNVPAFNRIGVPAVSIAVAAAGAYWLIDRTLLS